MVLKVEVKDKVMTMTISRPEIRNAWTEKLRDDICKAVDQANKDPNVRAVILTGDPAGNAFCAGMQLAGDKESAAVLANDIPEGRKSDNSTFRDGGGIASLAILNCTKPVIAAMNGAAVGVGMTLACCCDMRVMAEGSKCGFVFVRRGLACESISSWTLRKLVGTGKAMELVLTGRVFKSEEAPPGLFNYVLPKDQVLAKATELAREIADYTSAVGVSLSKFAILRNGNMSPEEAHLVESRMIHNALGSDDFEEGRKSFLEKRPPNFTTDPFRNLPEFYPWWVQIKTHPKL
ncbi:Enoyl-CoA hydratase, mitochondrial [Hondaea fermentalgiana]|uniref:Enoyl-CoA hydratase, mitochondrial n=1 Tax=Hondaea fermentalgiana TaxID=2315210 RepID=A0A2R5GP12_9STRA|nr:Enoyl-CoA hydratase, mitochondrial [Hondaea fermentalgiana]|eukprot:GBG30051.1 Enoyl-CoA hydratase, mitochondrial [Hondaea fermentalgiana]